MIYLKSKLNLNIQSVSKSSEPISFVLLTVQLAKYKLLSGSAFFLFLPRVVDQPRGFPLSVKKLRGKCNLTAV